MDAGEDKNAIHVRKNRAACPLPIPFGTESAEILTFCCEDAPARRRIAAGSGDLRPAGAFPVGNSASATFRAGLYRSRLIFKIAAFQHIVDAWNLRFRAVGRHQMLVNMIVDRIANERRVSIREHSVNAS